MGKKAGREKQQEQKTNVMRLLEQAKVSYRHYCYVDANETNGRKVAEILGQDPNRVFKTLLTAGKSGGHYVFVIPVNCELDLKKAAKAVGEKAVEMVKSKELLPLTGYIHGGCSPIGMKKPFPTVVHKSAAEYETICFSAGKVGYQVEVALGDLHVLLEYQLADLV